MKILFVLEHFYPYIGGAEKLFYVLCKALVKEGYKVTVITTRFDKTLPTSSLHEGIQIIRVNCWNRFAFTLFSLPKVFQYARKADFIHTTSYNAALPAMLIGSLLRKPVFITFHEVWGALWKSLPFIGTIQKYGFYYFEKILLRLPFKKFIAVSAFTKKKLLEQGISENRIVQIYNGLDYKVFESFKYQGSEIFTFTYFGRLGISKGLDLLIPAAARFRKQYPKSSFRLIIPKQPKALYQSILFLIKKHKLENYIEFQHNLPKAKLMETLLQSSCVVIPSYSEGFCFAATETVALKIPIISSHQGALPETVSGQFIKMEEMTIKALSNALIKAYQNKWQKTPIKYFPLEKTVAAYKTLFQV